MPVYLYLNLFTIFFPLILSFDKRVHFWKKWYAALPAVLVSATVFAIWDVYFTERGIWGFNPEYLVGIELLGLPLEEILFFITVPYACLFIYETLNTYWPREYIGEFANAITQGLVLLLVLLAGLYLNRLYTSVTFVFAPLVLGLHNYLFGKRHMGRFYRAYLVHLLPFLLVNGVLTYLPVVWYSNAHIMGPRIVSIPVEDSMYSLALFLLTVTIYEYIRERRERNTPAKVIEPEPETQTA